MADMFYVGGSEACTGVDMKQEWLARDSQKLGL